MKQISGTTTLTITSAAEAPSDEQDFPWLWSNERGASWTKDYSSGEKRRVYAPAKAVALQITYEG